jgi:ABC-2 type transport system permease protein
MNELLALLKVQVLAFFDINTAFHTKDKSARRKRLLLSGVVLVSMAMIMGMSFGYSFMLADALKKAGMGELLEYVPGLMMASACLATFFTTIYKTHGVLVGFRDYDQIMSLPVPVRTVIASRIILLYLMNLFFTLIIMLPAGIVYGMKGSPLPAFYLLFPLTLFVVPLLPIVGAAVLGIVISLVSSRFRHRNTVNLITSFALTLGIILLSTGAGQVTADFQTVSAAVADAIGHAYPPALWYLGGVCRGDMGSLGLFLGVSAAVFGLLVWGFSRIFQPLHSRLTAHYRTADFRVRSLKTGTPFRALYRKELTRYGASPLYVMNTAIGAALGILFCFGMAFFGQEKLAAFLELPGSLAMMRTFAPLIVAGFMALTCTTASSISLEGKNLWIMKSIPVEPFTLLMSKLAVNLTIQLPAVLLCGLALAYALKPSPFELLQLFLMPAFYSLFIAAAGLMINLKAPNFSWTSETVVIKQSMAVFLALAVGMAGIGVPVAVIALAGYFKIPLSAVGILWNFTMIMGFVDFILVSLLWEHGETWVSAL